jgi:hypothetical protein
MAKIINVELVWTTEDLKKHYEQYSKEYLINEIIRLRLENQNMHNRESMRLPVVHVGACKTDRKV